MKMISMVAVAVVIASATVGTSATAAERGAAERVAACATESDDARRLACYDREVGRGKPAGREDEAAAAASTTETGEGTAAAARKPPAVPAVTPTEGAEAFGVAGSEVARQRKNQEQKQEQPKITSIAAKVTEVSKRARGEVVVTLDNGQVWAQKSGERYFPIKVGDAITINSGVLGSYRLVNAGRSTQVTRIK